MTRRPPRPGSGRRPGAPRPRVFVVGFPGTDQAGNPDDLNAEQGYDPFPVHMNTVAGNGALVRDGAQRYPGIDFFGLNPGLIRTNIRGNYLGEGSLKHRFAEALIGLFTMSVETYGKRMAPLLVSPDVGNRGPAMFNQKGQAILASTVMTPDWVGKLMVASDVLLQRSAQG